MSPYAGIAIAIVVAATLGGTYIKGRSDGADSVQTKWNKATAAQVEAESAAVLTRLDDNAKLKDKQAEDNAAVTKAHDAEIDSVRRDLLNARRMRVPAFCPRTAAKATPESAGSGNAADTGERLLPEILEQRVRALILETEETAAIGRACQAFIRANGMVP